MPKQAVEDERVPRRLNVLQRPFPAYVVWELTLRCDQRCTHCGSRAADARPSELTTQEALRVVDQLARMGTRELALIGGEAYLHDGSIEIVAALRTAGIRPSMTTGGHGITEDLAAQMADAGLFSVSVSIDGMGATHDVIRATKGGFESANRALDLLREAGLRVGSNTNVNRLNAPEIETIYEHLRAHGVEGWQLQWTAALGRAADRPDMLLQPWDLLDLMPRVAALKTRALRDGITFVPGNNVGYFGPEEAMLRSVSAGGRDHWQGCLAGRFILGIESDGAVKGCPSLQTSHYVGGNLRERGLRDIWDESPELAFTRERTVADLWGFCRSCHFSETCLGGCSFTAHALFGRPGNNPLCHYRARTLSKQGLRERLVPRERAPGRPFDNGLFDLIVEPLEAPDPAPPRGKRLLRVWPG